MSIGKLLIGSYIIKGTMNLELHYQRFSVVMERYIDANWNTLLDDSNTTNGYMKRREKCAGGKLSLNSKVATEVLFFKKGTSINPFENENKVIATKIRVRESLMRGEGISTPRIRCIQREPLISLALN